MNQKTKSPPLLLLFDGHSIAYKAFHALPDSMATAAGQVTNMLVGFLNTFFMHYKTHKPERIVVCFDLPEPTFRHKKYKEYKANREKSPEIFRQQLSILHEILAALGVPVVEISGFEADDVLATLATLGARHKNNVIVVSGDRDIFQLVQDPEIKVLYVPTKGDAQLFNEKGIYEKMGVKPDSYVQYAALKGDVSDNLPGVPGVGDKRASALISNYKNIDGIYADLEKAEDITPSVKKALGENRHTVELNLEMMELKKDVKLGVKLADLKLGKVDAEKINQLFTSLELKKFDADLKSIWDFEVEETDLYAPIEDLVETQKFADSEKLVEHLESLNKKDTVLALAGSWSEEFRGMALAKENTAEKLQVVWIPLKQLREEKVQQSLRSILEEESPVRIIAHDAKLLLRELLKFDLDLPNLSFDSRLAAYLLNQQSRRLDLKSLVLEYAKLKFPAQQKTDGQLKFEDPDYMGESALETAGLLNIYKKMFEKLVELKEENLYQTMELPLVGVLGKMEYVGIGVDVEELKALNEKLKKASTKWRKAVIDAAGKEFNVNSTKELGEVLFTDLGLPPQKRTKQGFSTDASTLEKLKGMHKIVDCILEYRSVEKLRSTYGEGLLKEIKEDGRIHSTFNQTVAITGRLSSDAPNLHNIPIRTEMGREFRKVFVASKGYELLLADYNQIELRCIAHLCGDPNLKQAFATGTDIHSSVAERVFGIVPAPPKLREQAKMVSYGLMYGMETYGLSQRLNIEQSEAQEILDSFFEAYPSVKDYMDKAVDTAKKLGYTETLFGRRRYIPDLSAANHQVRAAAKRQAMNSGIQGLAADIFKYALIGIHKKLEAEEMESRIILQVHDEVILEVLPGEKDRAKEIVLTEMEGAAKLDVPLVVELSFGKTWNSAKGK